MKMSRIWFFLVENLLSGKYIVYIKLRNLSQSGNGYALSLSSKAFPIDIR